MDIVEQMKTTVSVRPVRVLVMNIRNTRTLQRINAWHVNARATSTRSTIILKNVLLAGMLTKKMGAAIVSAHSL